MKVKQLDFWKEGKNKYFALSKFGIYSITFYSEGWILELNKTSIVLNNKTHYESIESAKQAAQFDFERRIKGCFEEV